MNGGEATTLYPDWRKPDTFPTHLKLHLTNANCLVQELSYGDTDSARTLRSTATIHGSILKFEQGSQLVQVLLLPDGASSTCPVQIQSNQPFFWRLAGYFNQVCASA